MKDAVEQYRCSGCEHLIVDIRGNGGGADYVYGPILSVLYQQPGRTHGIVMRNTADNRDRWLQQYGPESEWLQALHDSATAHAAEPWYATTDEYELHEQEQVDPRRPKKAAVIIDKGVGSSGEQFLIDLRSVAPDIKFYGRDNTLGCIDISNVVIAQLPHVPNVLQIPTTISRRVLMGEGLIDGHGIEPDVRMDLALPDSLTDNVDEWVLWVANQLFL